MPWIHGNSDLLLNFTSLTKVLTLPKVCLVTSLTVMLSCGTAVSATTHIIRQKRLSCWNPFQPYQFPKRKISVQKHYSCAWTYQDWCHSSELEQRDQLSTQDSHDKLMEMLYPDNNYYIKHSNMHVSTDNTASSDRLNIKMGQTEFYNTYIHWPHWVVEPKQARLATMTQLFHLPVSHTNHANEFNRTTCVFWANLKCKYNTKVKQGS